MPKLKNRDVEVFLSDCLGYDELMIDEIKENYKPLRGCLSDEEMEHAKEYSS